MNRLTKAVSTIALFAAAIGYHVPALAQDTPPASAQPQRKGPRRPRVDMHTFVRPIDMHDTVWIEDMTQLEVRDSLVAGKTTALVFAGGMEDNGPYVIVSQHNSIVHAMCDSIARQLGNALCAPIIPMAPASPERSANPGSVSLSVDTYKGMATDIATSLKAQGFKNIFFMVDHGSGQKPLMEATKAMQEKWQGSGVLTTYVPEYYDYTEVEQYEKDVLNVHEKSDGFHDDYYTASISVAIDPETARMKERIKAGNGKTMLNGVDMASPKAAEDGKKIMAFRRDVTVKAIQKLAPGK
jgi:creatinine amidohydrolase